jgi:hypothetical protein
LFSIDKRTIVPQLDFLVQDLNLSHNTRLEGKLPEYWGRLTNAQRLDPIFSSFVFH